MLINIHYQSVIGDRRSGDRVIGDDRYTLDSVMFC